LAVGVVLPVHNEEELLGSALSALTASIEELDEWSVQAKAVVVLDACSDASGVVAEAWLRGLRRKRIPLEATVVSCETRNVGFARRLGFERLLHEWSHISSSRIWLATTDADSRVPKEWLTTQVAQHESGADFWSGRVRVDEWLSFQSDTATRWRRAYEAERNPVHGASLGFNAEVYLAAGCFLALRTGEDQALHRGFVALGARCHHDSFVRVTTSARREARAPQGFSHALQAIEA
jgi:glycosyltransferase involved in cell wall biosynthesis